MTFDFKAIYGKEKSHKGEGKGHKGERKSQRGEKYVKDMIMSLQNFLDFCHTEWNPCIPYDQSKNLRFSVRVKGHSYILTFVRDTKEIILREEHTANFFNHKLVDLAHLEWFDLNELIIKNRKMSSTTTINFENVRDKLLAESVILRNKVVPRLLTPAKRIQYPLRGQTYREMPQGIRHLLEHRRQKSSQPRPQQRPMAE